MTPPDLSENIFLVDLPAVTHPTPASLNPTPNSENIFLIEEILAAPATPPPSPLDWFNENWERLQSGSLSGDDFFCGLSKLLGDPDFTASILHRLSIFLLANPTFVGSLARGGVLPLDFLKPDQFDNKIRLLKACLHHEPSLVSVDAVQGLLRSSASPQKLVNLLWHFLNVCNSHPAARPIFCLFFESPKPYLFDEQFVYIAYHVYCNFAALRDLCFRVFAEAFLSDEHGLFQAACNVYSQIDGYTGKDIPIEQIINRIVAGHRLAECLEILAGLTEVPPSQRLLGALLIVGRKSEYTTFVLFGLAATPMGAALFMNDLKWMWPDCLSPDDSFKVFLRLCQDVEIRRALVTLAEFPGFLAHIAQNLDAVELIGIASLIRKLSLTPQLIAAVDAAGFLTNFFQKCFHSGNATLLDQAILVVDGLARITWVQGFTYFIMGLPYLWSCGGAIAGKALVAALALAPHPVAKPALADPKVIEGLRVMQAPGEPYAGYRASLLQFITS
jgi:hypothetical protein